MNSQKYLFIIFAFDLISCVFTKYNCGTKDVIYLNKGIIAYFEITNYPKLLTLKQFAACNLTFALAEVEDDNHLIVSMTFNGPSEISYEKTINIFQSSSFSLHNNHKNFSFSPLSYTAMKGFVVFADSNKTLRCPSETEPFYIFSDIEFIPIFDNLSSSYCIWKFSCPQNYGFKIVIVDLKDAKDMNIFIKNSTDTFVNKRSLKRTYPHYNEDNYLEIQLFNNSDKSFFGYVTIVEKINSTDKCHTTKNGTTITWHINVPLFSTFNTKCFFELIIPAATEFIVTVKKFIIEKNVDYIRYYVDKYNNSIAVDVEPDKDTIFELFNYNNGSDQRYLFEFSNDGSVPSFGTFITFEELTCQCFSPPVLKCLGDAYYHGIMDKRNFYYCGNLHCNFTVESCIENEEEALNLTGLLRFSIFSDKTVSEYKGDVLRTYSNGKIISEFEINYFTESNTNYLVYYNTLNLIFLEVLTFPSKIPAEIAICSQTIETPQINITYEISPSDPFIMIDLAIYQGEVDWTATIIKVLVSEGGFWDIVNPSLKIFSSKKYGVQLFNNESLSVSYLNRTCFGDLNPYSCRININELAILSLSGQKSYPILTAQLPDFRQKGCVFYNNLFTEKEFLNSPIVVISTPNDECVATLLIEVSEEYHYYMSELWTTSLAENVKVFAGNNSFLFEFNSRTSKKWTSIRLFAYFYTIIVPKNATLYIKMGKLNSPYVDSDHPVLRIDVPDNSYSLFSTPFYGTLKSSLLYLNDFLYCTNDRVIKFTAIYFNTPSFSLPEVFSHSIKKIGDHYLLKNGTCVLFEYIPSVFISYSNDDGVILLIETIDKEMVGIL